MDREHVKTDMIPLFAALAEDDQVSVVESINSTVMLWLYSVGFCSTARDLSLCVDSTHPRSVGRRDTPDARS